MASILIGLILGIAALVAALVLWTRYLGRDVETLVPQAGQVRPVPGGAIHHVDLGPRDAPAVVLIHGLSGQLQHFTYGVAAMLEQEFRVIALDRPGCGYSSRDSDDQATLPEQARMIWALLDDLEVARPVLVGHSLGGAVALAMALDRPEQVGALALISPLTHPQTDEAGAFNGLAVRSALMRRAIGHTLAVPAAPAQRRQGPGRGVPPRTLPRGFPGAWRRGSGVAPQGVHRRLGRLHGCQRGHRSTAGTLCGGLENPRRRAVRRGRRGSGSGAAWRPDGKFRIKHRDPAGPGHMLPITAPSTCADFIRRIATTAP